MEEELDFPEYLSLAYRLPAYQGVLAHRAAEEQRKKPRRGVRQVDGSREAVQSDPLLAAAISFS